MSRWHRITQPADRRDQEVAERWRQLSDQVRELTQEVRTLMQRVDPPPPEPRQAHEPEHVYALARGSVIEEPDSGRLWLVTEVVNPPGSGSHDPILLRLDANPNHTMPSSSLPFPLRILREGIGLDPAPAPVHRPIIYPEGVHRPS